LTVQGAEIVRYRIEARLFFYPGPESEPILNAAESSLNTWLGEQGRIGKDVARSAVMAALHVQGVQRVELVQPAADIVISGTQAAYCETFTITEGGRNE
ncbi:TPA: baseplate J/gp47 family protein, partial [Escherichia coli]|nr:baseplate J/gp47 family protein [Escherichia coli]